MNNYCFMDLPEGLPRHGAGEMQVQHGSESQFKTGILDDYAMDAMVDYKAGDDAHHYYFTKSGQGAAAARLLDERTKEDLHFTGTKQFNAAAENLADLFIEYGVLYLLEKQPRRVSVTEEKLTAIAKDFAKAFKIEADEATLRREVLLSMIKDDQHAIKDATELLKARDGRARQYKLKVEGSAVQRPPQPSSLDNFQTPILGTSQQVLQDAHIWNITWNIPVKSLLEALNEFLQIAGL